MKPPKAQILVVEDDSAILSGLMDVLVFNGYGARGQDNGREGLTCALKTPFDLVILDVMLPEMDGFTLCRKLRAKRPALPVLMLTAKGAEEDVITGFKAGADDYVCKPFSLRELLVRVEALLRRSGKPVGRERFEWRQVAFDGTTLTAGCGDQTLAITRRELDILYYLYRHMDRIVSKSELLTQVWHYTDPTIETRTVDIHIQKLRKKLTQLRPQVSFIKTIRGQGYRLEPAS